MTSLLAALALVLDGARVVFLALAVACLVVCIIDWMARTRRISPFGALARWSRRVVDPLLAPIERRVVRSGGVPGAVPWWALAAVVVGGILVLTLLQFVVAQVAALAAAAQAGPRGLLVFAVATAFGILQLAILVRVIASWIPALSPQSPWVRWAFVLSEPVLGPLRRIIPPLGMVDITPIIAYFAVQLVGGAVVGMLR